MSIGGVILAKEKEKKSTILDRSAPGYAIQITEISVDATKNTRRRQSVAHLTVTNLSGERQEESSSRQSKRQEVDKKSRP